MVWKVRFVGYVEFSYVGKRRKGVLGEGKGLGIGMELGMFYVLVVREGGEC